MVSVVDVDKNQIEWILKVKTEISVCTAVILNEHSNSYTESTTVPLQYVNQLSTINSALTTRWLLSS